jgi:xanthine/CO dehydrogenase XdhC/CoxF family maturation factor
MEVRIAGVNRWAARQQRVRKGWAAVILQRTDQRIGIDLIARASQITAAVIAAEVVSSDVTVPPSLKMFSPDAPAFRIVLEI